MSIIMREFDKANRVMKRILAGEVPWSRLFKKLDFYKAYSSYLRADILTRGEKDPGSIRGLLEGHLRKLVAQFEK